MSKDFDEANMMANATITIKSSELLSRIDPNDENTSLLRWLLQVIATYLDDNGAADQWNLRHIALVSAIGLGIIRYSLDKKFGVDWCALIHAIITTIGSVVCWYIDTYYESSIIQNDTGDGTVWAEPMRTISMCAPPLTSVHRILASITLGYSLLDFIHGLTLGADFLFHGMITMFAMGYAVEMQVPQVVSALLIMEGSTIFLSMIRATFFNEIFSLFNMVCFVLSFFICRCVMAPYLWWKLMYALVTNYQTRTYQECYHKSLMDSVFVSGMMFNLLNAYWFYKIMQKVQRKLSGTEKVHSNNDLVDEKPNGKNNDHKKNK